jgi:hypothetical protein
MSCSEQLNEHVKTYNERINKFYHMYDNKTTSYILPLPHFTLDCLDLMPTFISKLNNNYIVKQIDGFNISINIRDS